MARTILGALLLITLPAHAQLNCNFTITPENCSEANGTVIASVFGGTPPYTYLWTPNPPNGQGTPDLTGLAAGSYDLLVTDDLGTQQTFTAVVPNDPTIGFAGSGTLAGAEPYVGLGVPCSGQCNGAMAFPASMFGGTPPYTFDWGPPAAYTAQGDPVFTGLCPGQSYPYTVYDAFGCSSTLNTGPIPELDTAWYWSVDLVTPATCGNTNGILHLTQTGTWPADVSFTQGGQVVLTTTTNGTGSAAIGGLAPGAYEVLFDYNASGCTSSLTFTMPAVGPGCGSVAGTLFLDSDADCVADAGEPGIPYRTLQVDPGAQLVITNLDGSYAGGLADGAYTLTVLDPTVTPACPQAQPIPFAVSGNVSTLHIGAGSSSPMDLTVTAVNNAARPGFSHTVWAQVLNTGTTASGTVDLTCVLHPALSYQGAVPAPTNVTGNTLTWSLPAVAPFSSVNVQVIAQLSTAAQLGDVVDMSFTAVNNGPEANTTNNSYTATRTVTGSYDPNDKTAFTSTRQSSTDYVLAQDEWIDYVIRFQNTGTDTAFTVVVVDTLAAELDMASYEQGAASHPFTVNFLPGRVVEWRFANILLPDSNTNEPLSHGAVGFRIRPAQPLAAGTVLANAADIFFDFNPPIRTNTSELVASVSTGVHEMAPGQLQVYPNPAHDRITLSASGMALRHVRITALDGRTMLQLPIIGDRADVDISELATGPYLVCITSADGRVMQQRVVVL